jgi:hypothetical protein
MDDRRQDRPLIGNETVSWQDHHWPLSGNSVRCFVALAMQFLLPVFTYNPSPRKFSEHVAVQGQRFSPSGGRPNLEETMTKIYFLVLAAIASLLLIEGSSWGKLQVASCGRHSGHSVTRCHVAHHNNHYGMALRGNIYGQAANESAVGSATFYNSIYYGSDPDARIVFELHRDPGWSRSQ